MVTGVFNESGVGGTTTPQWKRCRRHLSSSPSAHVDVESPSAHVAEAVARPSVHVVHDVGLLEELLVLPEVALPVELVLAEGAGAAQVAVPGGLRLQGALLGERRLGRRQWRCE